MAHEYTITLTKKTGSQAGESLHFNTANHDDLFAIVDKIKDRALVDDAEATEFAIALKLFGEVLLRHRKDAIFAELAPHFGQFMKKIKGQSPSTSA